MTQQQLVLLEVADGVGWLTLNRPEKRNALSDELIAALASALASLEGDARANAIALRGAGKDFCAGADLSALQKISGADLVTNLHDVDALAALFLQIRHHPKPVVALVHGRALAGGCGLATACDMILAAEDARIGYPEVNLGFVPAMVMAMLRRNVPEKRAFEMVTLGQQISAAEAVAIGLINQVIPAAEFEATAAGVMSRLAAQSPSALMLCKRLLYHQDGMSFESALRAGGDVNVLARYTEDMKSGLARFLQKRP